MKPVALSPSQREAALDAMESRGVDVLVVGGGVVGAGCALDAATRGLEVGLVEARDYASGTSSRSSKLIHGGLRYLEMLDFGLVSEALQERGLLIQTLAPHLVRPVPFVYPLHGGVWERSYAGAGVAAVRHDGPVVRALARGAPSPSPHPTRCPQDRAVAAQGRADRRPAVLRRAGRRRTAHDVPRAHGSGVRRPRREPDPGRRSSSVRASA